MTAHIRSGARARLTTLLGVALAAAATSLVLAAPASAVQTDIYDPFTACPLDDPLMSDPEFGYAGVGCVAAITNGGSFKIRQKTTQITKPVKVQFGNGSFDEDHPDLADCPGGACLPVVQPPNRHAGLVAAPEKVPGGLLNLSRNAGPGTLGTLVRGIDEASLNQVKADTRLAGDISHFDLLAPLGGEGPAFWLPVKIKLINPVLGDRCFIGSNQDPIVLKPEFTTLPQLGLVEDPNGFDVLVIQGFDAELLDDSFAVPKADGCGPGGTLDGLVNSEVGLPSPSGRNRAEFLDSDPHLAVCNRPPGTVGGLAAECKAAFAAAKE